MDIPVVIEAEPGALPERYTSDYITGLPVRATPEEIDAVQVFARRLVEDFGYPRDHIQTRPQFHVRRRPSESRRSYPVDIAVFTTPAHQEENLHIVVECKRKNRRDGRRQLEILITKWDTDILFQHHLAKMRALGDTVDGPLLMACLLSPIVQKQIRARQFTADVIDSIVGRLPEVKLPLHRSSARRRDIAQRSASIFTGRADARARLAWLCRGLDDALASDSVSDLVQQVFAPRAEGSGRVTFLGSYYGAETFTVSSSAILNGVLVPRYYDPVCNEQLARLRSRCWLVTIRELVEQGVLSLQTGDEVGKLAYGTGDVTFVRTSDFANWELKHDPKQRVSRDVYDAWASKQSAAIDDVLVVRDGIYLVGTSTIVQDDDLPLLFSGGIYRIRVMKPEVLSPALLLALLNSRIVRRQIRNKQFTRDVIDTLGHRFEEIVLPIPIDMATRSAIGAAMQELIARRAKLRREAAALGGLVEMG